MNKKNSIAPALLLALLISLAHSTCFAAAVTDIDAILASPELRSGKTAIAIWDIDANQVIYEKNIDSLMTPASNMKILTAAVSIIKLGTEFQFRTDFFVSGWNQNTGTAQHLYVRGTGDPTFSGEFFESNAAAAEAIAVTLVQHGLRRVTGNIIIDDRAFSGAEYPRGWDAEDSGYCYGMKVGALSFAENCLKLKVTGSTAGKTPYIEADPPISSKFSSVKATTSAKGGRISASMDSAGIIRISGAISPGKTTEIEYPIPHPGMFFGNVIAGALHRQGVQIDGKLARANGAAPAGLQQFASIGSPYLSNVLAVMLKKSDNFIAETMLRALAADKGGTVDSGAAEAKSIITRSKYASPQSLTIYDGSGLSRQNKLTPRVLMMVLAAFYNSNLKSGFAEMLAQPGQKGTLKKRLVGTPAEGRLWAKTGALSGACSLSGYFTRANGNTAAFSMIMNGYTVHSNQIRNIQDKLILLLLDL